LIYPGTWEFVVRGISTGRQRHAHPPQLFHWDYLNETLRKKSPRRADFVGVFVVGIDQPDNAAAVSLRVDEVFRNSLAETLTETEQAFQLGFVAMSDQIIAAIRVVSYVVIVIILAVMANTMAMSARERTSEYATLKALGFGRLPRRADLRRVGGDRAIGARDRHRRGRRRSRRSSTRRRASRSSRSRRYGRHAGRLRRGRRRRWHAVVPAVQAARVRSSGFFALHRC
jgi:hypothetical protein